MNPALSLVENEAFINSNIMTIRKDDFVLYMDLI